MTLRDKIDYLIAKHISIKYPKIFMFCPACKNRLYLACIITRKYQTLCEHVSEPNDELPWKPIFWCFTEHCELNMDNGSFFGAEGSYYGPTKITKDCWQAIGSLSYWVEKDCQKAEKRRKNAKANL